MYSHNAGVYPFRKFCEGDDIRIVGRVLGKITDKERPSAEESAMLEELHREGNI